MPVFFLLKTESGDFHRRFAFVFYSLIVATAIRRAVKQRPRRVSAKAYASEAVAVPVAIFRRRSTVTTTTAATAATAAVIAVHADIAVTVAANALKTAVPPATAVVATVATIATTITAATRTIEIESRITRIPHSFV